MTFSLMYPSNRYRRSQVRILLAMWVAVTFITLVPCKDDMAAVASSPASVDQSVQQQDSDCTCPLSGTTHTVSKALGMSSESVLDTAQHLPLSLPFAMAMMVLPTATLRVGENYTFPEKKGRTAQRLYLTTSLRVRA